MSTKFNEILIIMISLPLLTLFCTYQSYILTLRYNGRRCNMVNGSYD